MDSGDREKIMRYLTGAEESAAREWLETAGQPYCTHCSRLALDAGIAEFVLWHNEGIAVYPTDEYNNLSYRYKEEPHD